MTGLGDEPRAVGVPAELGTTFAPHPAARARRRIAACTDAPDRAVSERLPFLRIDRLSPPEVCARWATDMRGGERQSFDRAGAFLVGLRAA